MLHGSYFSLRLKLDNVVSDRNFEQLVLENIRRCARLTGKQFKVIFWHEKLTKKECDEFVLRNKKLLLNINVQITKMATRRAWFLINSENEKSSHRYRYDGNILEGITKYIEMVKIIQKRNN